MRKNAEGYGKVWFYPCPSLSYFSEIKPLRAKLHRMDHDAQFKMLLKAPAILRGFIDFEIEKAIRDSKFEIRDWGFNSNLEFRIPLNEEELW
jgi:hypothetical protein